MLQVQAVVVVSRRRCINHQLNPVAPAAAAPLMLLWVERVEKRVPMTRLRKRVTERLFAATQETAMLTTFNEVKYEANHGNRAQYKDAFDSVTVRVLALCLSFVKAATEALKRYPAVNASIDGDTLFTATVTYDIGSSIFERGLVVPVLRDTDRINYAEVEMVSVTLLTKHVMANWASKT